MAKKILITFGFLITIFMITSAIIDMNKRSESIEKNKYTTIAKINKFSSNRSFSYYYYEYFYKGKKYQDYGDIDTGNQEECINKYYRVTISTENPEYSKVYLNLEVIDSSEIRNAGFE